MYPPRELIESAYADRNLIDASKAAGIKRRKFENALNFYGIKRRGPGDATRLRYDRQPMLTDSQLQLALGSLLGDASLCVSNSQGRPSWVLAFAHGKAQLPYLAHKKSVIGGCKISPRPIGSNLGQQMYQFHFKNRVALEQVAKLCMVGWRKTINQRWLDRIDDRGVAYWFQDDGSTIKTESGHHIRFYTNSFSRPEIVMLVDFLWKKFNLHCTIVQGNNRYEPVICASTVSQVKDFLIRLSPYVSPSLEYKFPCLQSPVTEKK